mmetsp:Transcript_48397/g.155782  ORF Transcript_48397/g.155782 Transcript_48397/m.155782 type:complete len:231 (+) Transcript_48397:389-1081(+)
MASRRQEQLQRRAEKGDALPSEGADDHPGATIESFAVRVVLARVQGEERRPHEFDRRQRPDRRPVLCDAVVKCLQHHRAALRDGGLRVSAKAAHGGLACKLVGQAEDGSPRRGKKIVQVLAVCVFELGDGIHAPLARQRKVLFVPHQRVAALLRDVRRAEAGRAKKVRVDSCRVRVCDLLHCGAELGELGVLEVERAALSMCRAAVRARREGRLALGRQLGPREDVRGEV